TSIHRSLLTVSCSRRLGGQALRLLDSLVDVSDHVEGGFRQVVVVAVAEALEALDRILQIDQLARRAGEHFCHEEGLRQEALHLAGRSEEHTSELQSREK